MREVKPSAIRVLVSAARVSMRDFLDVSPPKLYVALVLPRMLFQVLFFYLVALLAGGKSLASYALVGNAFAVSATSVLTGINNSVRSDRSRGTLEMIVASPAPVLPVVLGECACPFVEGVFRSSLVLFLMGPLMGITGSQLLRACMAFPIMIVTIMSLVGLGFLIGSIGLTSSRFNFMPNVATYTLMFLSGVNYPVEALPQWAQAVARVLPMTHGLEGFRAVMQGVGGSAAWYPFIWEVCVAMAYLALGWSIFERRVSATRQGVSDFV